MLQLSRPKLMIAGADPSGKAGELRGREFFGSLFNFFNRAHAVKLGAALKRFKSPATSSQKLAYRWPFTNRFVAPFLLITHLTQKPISM